MILSNTATFEALEDGRLVIDPEPSPRLTAPGGPKSPFDTTAIDLRLSSYYSEPRDPGKLQIDLETPGSIIPTLATVFDTKPIPAEGFKLTAGSFIPSQTLETVHLRHPKDFTGGAIGRSVLAARVEGKSSLARLGLLIHFTAPTIHNGFGPAPIVLEIICLEVSR